MKEDPPMKKKLDFHPYLFTAFVFVFANWFLTTLSLALVHERVPDRTQYGPLPDVFLDHVPAADWALDVSEILIIISTTSCMVLIFFHKYRYIYKYYDTISHRSLNLS